MLDHLDDILDNIPTTPEELQSWTSGSRKSTTERSSTGS